ncbi:hypothetical protein RND71_005213 [Anisodus tanguticus]|uniref:Uncharacterized protein n=1 Tax=Anisodus tanguticus TaxID=243964 RepID=A0AAE1SRP9_9SOLA|nr:hypothetical protein RND71_005213 [Anisodus tanguticus]
MTPQSHVKEKILKSQNQNPKNNLSERIQRFELTPRFAVRSKTIADDSTYSNSPLYPTVSPNYHGAEPGDGYGFHPNIYIEPS